jgi:hypothetical protein
VNILEYVTKELPRKRKLDKQLDYLELASTGSVASDKLLIANCYLAEHPDSFFEVYQAGVPVKLTNESNPNGLCVVKSLASGITPWGLVDANNQPVPSAKPMVAKEAITYLNQRFRFVALTGVKNKTIIGDVSKQAS